MVKFLDNNSGFKQWSSQNNKSTNSKGAKNPPKFSGWLLWVAVFFLSYFLISSFLFPKKKETLVVPAPQITEQVASNVPVFNTSGNNLSLNVQGLRISDIELKHFKSDDKKSLDNVVLFDKSGEYLELGLIANGTTAPDNKVVWKSTSTADSITMRWTNSDKVDFTRTVKLDGYIITVQDEIKNNSGKDISFMPYTNILRDKGKDSAGAKTGTIAHANFKTDYNKWKRLDKKQYAYQTEKGFAGFADQYWETVVSLGTQDQTILIKKSEPLYNVNIVSKPISIANGESAKIENNVFTGPRDQKVLSDAAAVIPGLDKTIDYGWISILSRPMLWTLNAIHEFVLNYGIAIILLTILLRILMWPLTRKSFTSMMAMQKMQPELAKVQKRYAKDKARLQVEMMKLYKTNKTSPMSGCLPMLFQLPIFLALYNALLVSVPMRQASFLWISDLSVMDPFFILPLLMGATMWLQQHLQGVTTGPANPNDPMAQTQKMMKYMPIIFTAMFLWMPSGLILYWTVSNMFGIGQMYLIKKTQSKK